MKEILGGAVQIKQSCAGTGTSAQRDRQAGIRAWCCREKKAIFAQNFTMTLSGPGGKAGSREASTE